jgi:hypothetical protein
VTYIEDNQRCGELERRIYEYSVEIERLTLGLGQNNEEFEKMRMHCNTVT